MSCSGCGLNKPIQNKKYNLCSDCVFKKSHNGQSRQEVYSERSVNKPQKVYVFKRSLKPIKQQTAKEAVVKKRLSDVKKEIEEEAIQNDEYYCKGCGVSHMGLDKSHLLSIGQYKHLELIRRNIQLLCRKCHIIWEGRNLAEMIQLHCFFDNMLIIKDLDVVAYNMLVTKLIEYLKCLSEKQRNVLSVERPDLSSFLDHISVQKIS